jgi:integrase
MRENPVKAISKPPAPAHRDKVLTRSEIRSILVQLRRSGGSVSDRVALAFLFALRTGMRAGEICGIRRMDVNVDSVTLPMTKNGTRRGVPLSRKAHKVLGRALKLGHDPVFGLTSASLDALFRKARTRAGLSGFTFHDSRHHFCTYAARKLSPFELARMMGHKDLKMTMRYYNESASNIAAKLDK